jgi:hypothetical protein
VKLPRHESDRPIGLLNFIDGCARVVYLTPAGTQYVLDGAGEPVTGTWVLLDPSE